MSEGGGRPLFGLVAEFARPDELLAAAQAARAAGFRELEAYSPFPVEGLAEALGLPRSPISLLALAGGLVAGGGAMLTQLFAFGLNYVLNIGGRPLFAWQSYVLPSFATGVLGAGATAVLAMLLLNRLPRLHQPIFEHDRFHLATRDRFFLRVGPGDGTGGDRFDEEGARRWLEGRDPLSIRRLAA